MVSRKQTLQWILHYGPVPRWTKGLLISAIWAGVAVALLAKAGHSPLLIGTVLFLLFFSHFFAFAAGGDLVVEKGDSDDDERP
jgi:hypothetical protein